MNVQRVMQLMQRSLPLAAAMFVGVTSIAAAQGQQLFEWSGRVDREVQISMRDDRLSTRDIGSNDYGRARSRVFSTIPRRDGQVVVRTLNGRGNVDVIQQPQAQNGYTTVVRIVDRAGGADDYRIAAYWEGYSNGDVRGRDRDDRNDRDDRGGYDNGRGNGGYNNGRAIGRGNGRGNGGYDDGRDNGRDNGGYGNGAYGNGSMLHWSGNVDGELEIRIQNGRVDYRTLSGAQPTSIRANVGNMPNGREIGSVYIGEMQGRGSVNVIQQPSSSNGFTTVIRVRDPQGGYGYYSFDVLTR